MNTGDTHHGGRFLFYGLVLLAVYLAYLVIQPFMQPLLWASVVRTTTMPSSTSVDLFARVTMTKNLTASVSVINAFNRNLPFDQFSRDEAVRAAHYLA